MSEQSGRLKRPQQVTMAVIAAGSASLVMLLSIGDQLSRWNSVDLREKFVEDLAQDDLGRRLGVSVDQALSLGRVGLFVIAAVAAAVLVLSVFAARRDRGARLALSVLAVPLLLLSLVTLGLLVDPLLAGFVVVGAVLLWRQPSRDWYDGRPPRERAEATPTERVSPPAVPPAGPPPSPQPPTPPVDVVDAPPPTGQPVGGPAPYSGAYGSSATRTLDRPVQPTPSQDPQRRPSQVVAACVTTWVVSGIVAVGTLLSLVGTLVPGARSQVRDQVEKVLQDASSRRGLDTAGISVDELLVTAQVMLVVILIWALAAAALAVLAFTGQGWARVVLLVSAVFAGLLGLLGVLGALPLLLITAACAFTISRLVSPPAARWYAAREQQRRTR